MSTVPDASQRACLEAATSYYEKSLEAAETWLASRGIPLDLAREYRLGVVAAPCSGHESYVGRLAIPYLTRSGVSTIRFRALDDSTPKYLSLPRDTGRLYNTGAFFLRSPRIALIEGEFDALVTHEYAGIPAIGLQGASAWRPIYRRCFASYAEILVVGDGDEAGRKFVDRVVADLDNSRPVYLPDGADCNSLYLDEGPEGLIAALRL
jgi:DNA primase